MKKYHSLLLATGLLLFLFACKKEPVELEGAQDLNGNNIVTNEKAAAFVRFDEIANKSLPFQKCDEEGAIGGGPGYAHIVTTGTKILNLYDNNGFEKSEEVLEGEFRSMILDAVAGDVIFIEDQVSLTLHSQLVVATGVTIASNRGWNGSEGAVIRSTLTNEQPLFIINSDGVRFSGLKFIGNQDSRAIEAYNVVDFEVDNCEFYNWVDAIDVSEHFDRTVLLTAGAFRIHHNYIHKNLYGDPARGYGIMVYNAFASIYANIFRDNRHDIAGVGPPKSGFDAYCNIILPGSSKVSNFDMHGDYGNSRDYAGGFMHIHHNDFRHVNPQANIFPVGKPTTLCLVDNNRFATDHIFGNSSSPAIRQQACCGHPNSSAVYGNIVAVNNTYANKYLGYYVRNDWDKSRTDNIVRIPSSNDLLHAAGYAKTSGNFIDKDNQRLDIWFGDFDGDGITDIFKGEGGKWKYLPINTGYTDQWIHHGTSAYKVGDILIDYSSQNSSDYSLKRELIIDNFDADNTSDFLRTTGSEWKVSFSSNLGWTTWVTSGYTMTDLRFGKFHKSGKHDEIVDVLTSSSNQWIVSYDGSSWANAASSGYALSTLKLGDFDGDGSDDVFCATGTEWIYSSNALGSWNYSLANSDFTAQMLEIADFNGDGTSDVIGFDNGWQVSISGTSNWKPMNTTFFPTSTFPYGEMQ